MQLLNLFLLVTLTLTLLFLFLHRGAGPCGVDGEVLSTIRAGNTFCAIAENTGISVGDMRRRNPKLLCDALTVGSNSCLPK
jgi:hypothetical protein